MPNQTERIIDAFREVDRRVGGQPSMIERAMLDLADQRDELVQACEALIAYRDKVGPLSFQLEKADDYIRMMRLALEKVRGTDGD